MIHPMVFHSFILTPDGKVAALAQGHADEVLRTFHEMCSLVLGGRGAWRITDVIGSCQDEYILDSDMSWTLRAKLKNN